MRVTGRETTWRPNAESSKHYCGLLTSCLHPPSYEGPAASHPAMLRVHRKGKGTGFSRKERRKEEDEEEKEALVEKGKGEKRERRTLPTAA